MLLHAAALGPRRLALSKQRADFKKRAAHARRPEVSAQS